MLCRVVALVVGFVIAPLTAEASQSVACSLRTGQNAMPARFVLVIDTALEVAKFEPALMDARGQEVVGKTTLSDSGRVEIRFTEMLLRNNRGQQTFLRSSFSYIPNRSRGTMVSIPGGYKNRFIAHYACRSK